MPFYGFFSCRFLFLVCIFAAVLLNNAYNVKFTNVKLKSIVMYKIRVLTSGVKMSSLCETCVSYFDAVDRFLFYVHLALEHGLSVRCVNIIKGRKSIKMFVNHG